MDINVDPVLRYVPWLSKHRVPNFMQGVRVGILALITLIRGAVCKSIVTLPQY